MMSTFYHATPFGQSTNSSSIPPSTRLYDQNSKPQRLASQAVKQMAFEAVHSFKSRTESMPHRLVDYACATGKHSLLVFEPAIRLLASEGSIPELYLCDLPGNDFNQVADLTSANQIGCLPRMVARSFNQQIMPRSSVSLGICSTALHWVEQGFLWDRQFRQSFSQLKPDEREICMHLGKQWTDQWIRFLELRAAETEVGGQLLTCHLARPNDTGERHGPLLLWESAIENLQARQVLSQDDVSGLFLPIYRATQAQIMGQFDHRKISSHWTVVRSRSWLAPDPHYIEYVRSRDLRRLAKSYANFVLAIAQPLLRKIGENPPIGALRAEMIRLIAEDPFRYRPQVLRVLVRLRKHDEINATDDE